MDPNPLKFYVHAASRLQRRMQSDQMTHMVADMNRFVSELYRILKFGGVVVIGVPSVCIKSPLGKDLWRFTHDGLILIGEPAFDFRWK